MNSLTAYQAALDDMYAGYMARRHLVAARQDREFKDPEILLSVARKLDLLPPAHRTVKVTGSKGKGSTTRLIAFYLRQLSTQGDSVALFVSPEEFEHTDRMKIDGVPIGRDEFVDIFEALRPHLTEAAGKLSDDTYLSPFGIFLLISLVWFKRRCSAWHVLEIGRGGAHDEVGVLPAHHAVITSIFEEHADHLGPTLCDIAKEKAAVAVGARGTLVSTQAERVLKHCDLWDHHLFEAVGALPLRSNLPRWLAVDDMLARQAVTAMTQVEEETLLAIDIDNVSAAWGAARYRRVEIIYDALINLESLDVEWFERSFGAERLLVLFSLPDDKDRSRITAFFDAVPNAVCKEIVLQGKRGYLSYLEAQKRPERVCAEIHYEDHEQFLAVLGEQITQHAPTKVYCFGTHTYIRLVKLALNPK